MKSLSKRSMSVAMIAVVAGCVGCENSPPPASIPAPESAVHFEDDSVTSAEVEQEIDEAVDATSAYAGQKKEEYQAQMQRKLDELEAKIDELEVRAEAASEEAEADAKRQYEETMARLKQKRQATADRLAELKDASGDAWKDIAAGVDAAWSDLKVAFSAAASRFDDAEDLDE